MRRKILLTIIVAVMTSMTFIACAKDKKEETVEDTTETVAEAETTEDIEVKEADDEKQDFDSKNAYEYAKLESLLQSIKRDTDEE